MRRAAAVVAILFGLLAAPAAGRAQITDASDPMEPVNRLNFHLNALLLDYLIDPMARLYDGSTSPAVREATSNLLANLREPFSVLAYALEGRWSEAGVAFKRFAVNSTLGLAGLRDRAAEDGLARKARDLAAALCALDLPPGPYFVIPAVGPTTVRESLGTLATMALQYGVLGGAFIPYYFVETVVRYSELAPIYRQMVQASPDPYVSVRSAYLAHRAAVCADAAGADASIFLR